MKKVLTLRRSWAREIPAALMVGFLANPAGANPVGGRAAQGTASFNSQGPVLTIQTSDRAQINWNSFNIGVGETTTFLQPSSSSVVWNQINDMNPSQILGNLNANGYVVLQNSSGFSIGGQAVISTHGLVMTTSTMPAPDLSSAGAWQFNAPPPTASIINYGQIRQPEGDRGGSVFLIAADIQNNGMIQAPQGQIGLYAGQQVMVSQRPDGRGLSARVTLPQGSVNNQGQLVADAGVIAINAQVVNQGGLVQANSVRNVNGAIELVASDSVNLGAGSAISAQGDAAVATPSQGGFVVVKSGKTFTDDPGSSIDVSGKTGGRDGVVEVFGTELGLSGIQSQIDSQTAARFSAAGGWLMVNPQNLTLSTAASTPSTANPNINVNDLAGFSKIDLFAARNINVNSAWNPADSQDADAVLRLSAGNNLTLSSGSLINAGNNWNLNFSAGANDLMARPVAGNGIYLNGNSYIQTRNGNIDLWAANEVFINPGAPYPRSTGPAGINGIRTRSGGNIDVTAQYGDVNTGGNYNGFIFGQSTAPYYRVSPTLGGISTCAGGDVTITAGGNVTSFLPGQSDYNQARYDGGTGAFGPQPGNVTINAGGSVFGHYVLANGMGSITAGSDIGAPEANAGFALSLIKGSWSVSAPNGSIYLQDVRNPNGTFSDTSGFAGYHLFDYDPAASLTLQAANSVKITGAGAPHLLDSGDFVPLLFPPSLRVNAGSGGFVLNADVTLFPSPQGELQIITTHGGNFESYQDPATPDILNSYTLSMSDSAQRQWLPPSEAPVDVFGLRDHARTPPELNNPNPVELHISGSINNVTLHATKPAHITVDGDTFNFGFLGQNYHANDATTIDVAGRISYSPVFAFTGLSAPIVGANPLMPGAWDGIFSLLVDPNVSLQVNPEVLAMTPAQQTAYAYANLRLVLRDSYQLQPGYDPGANPGFIYDPVTHQLGFQYQMRQNIFSALDHTAIPILRLDALGHVVVERHADGRYYFATTMASFVPPAELERLYAQSVNSARDAQHLSVGFQLGGPGQFNINAASLDLGSSAGIISWGVCSALNPVDYGFLAPWTGSGGADVNVTVQGNTSLLTSTIASIYGGDVTVHSEEGGIFLSQGNFALIPSGANLSYGIFTSGHSDVSVTARDDINVGAARIAAFNGGDVFVRSGEGDVDAGNGANSVLVVPVIRRDPITGQLVADQIQNPRPFGSGIMAISPTADYQSPGANGLPGNIRVETPQGDIVSTLGGIQQIALNGSVAGGPTITLVAGTPASSSSSGHVGNVDLGQGGIVGGTINIAAQGSIRGLIVSRQDANINAAQSFSGTLLSGGSANVTASAGSVSGTVIGIGGVSASGGSGVSASVMGQNVSIGGGPAQSTLGTTAAATSASQAAAQQASSDTKQQLAQDNMQDQDDSKKKKATLPTLVRRVGRVTVILPGS